MVALDRLRTERDRGESYWVRQTATMFEADIQWLLGDKNSAFETLEDAWKTESEPPTAGFEGRFARWRTLLFMRHGRIDEIRTFLDSLFQRIESVDMFDQAEILCSMEYVRKQTGGPRSEVAIKALAVLSRLPTTCSTQLEQLGLLLPD